MKYLSFLVLFLVFFVQAIFPNHVSAGRSYDDYGYYGEDLWVNNSRNYWYQGEIADVKFRYQYGLWGYFTPDNRKVDFEFETPFTGKLIQRQDYEWEQYSQEVRDIKQYEFDFENTTQISLDLVHHYNVDELKLILEYQGKKVELEPLKMISIYKYIYSDSLENTLNNTYFLSRDLSHFTGLEDREIIIDKALEQEEYDEIIELIISNRVILNEQKNTDFLKYIYWENFAEYKIQQIAHYQAESIIWDDLKIVEKKHKYGENEVRIEKFVEIPYEVYFFWKMNFWVLKQDRDFYIQKWVNNNFLFFYANTSYYKAWEINVRVEYENSRDWKSMYMTDEILDKYIGWGWLTAVMIVYLIWILGFYFLYHKRLKRRITIIYFSLAFAIIFFLIYTIWLRIHIGTQNIIYTTSVYHNFENFTLKEDYVLYFWVKKSEFTYDFSEKFDTDISQLYDNSQRYSRQKPEISQHQWENREKTFNISALRYIFVSTKQLVEKPNFENLELAGKSNEELLTLAKPVKHFVKKYSQDVEYTIQKSENSDEKSTHYILNIQY